MSPDAFVGTEHRRHGFVAVAYLTLCKHDLSSVRTFVGGEWPRVTTVMSGALVVVAVLMLCPLRFPKFRLTRPSLVNAAMVATTATAVIAAVTRTAPGFLLAFVSTAVLVAVISALVTPAAQRSAPATRFFPERDR